MKLEKSKIILNEVDAKKSTKEEVGLLMTHLKTQQEEK